MLFPILEIVNGHCKESLRDKISALKSSTSGDSNQLAAPRKKWTDTRQDNTAIQTDRIVDTSSSDESIPLAILKNTWATRKPPEKNESKGPTVKICEPGRVDMVTLNSNNQHKLRS